MQNDFIDFLRGLFKGGPSDEFVKLAYITGIFPIKKYGTQSALNNFRELTMTVPGGAVAKMIEEIHRKMVGINYDKSSKTHQCIIEKA